MNSSETTFCIAHEANEKTSGSEFRIFYAKHDKPAIISAKMFFLLGRGDHTWRFMLKSSGLATVGMKWNPIKDCDAFMHGTIDMKGFAGR